MPVINLELNHLLYDECEKLIAHIDKLRNYFLDQYNFDDVVTDRVKGPLIHNIQISLHVSASQLEMVKMYLNSDK